LEERRNERESETIASERVKVAGREPSGKSNLVRVSVRVGISSFEKEIEDAITLAYSSSVREGMLPSISSASLTAWVSVMDLL
jgi:hypothetical protein